MQTYRREKTTREKSRTLFFMREFDTNCKKRRKKAREKKKREKEKDDHEITGCTNITDTERERERKERKRRKKSDIDRQTSKNTETPFCFSCLTVKV